MLKLVASNLPKQSKYLPIINHVNFHSSSQNQNEATTNTKSTIDHREIDTFKSLASKWWDENGALKPLHAFNMLRVPFVRDCLSSTGKISKQAEYTSKPLINQDILDVGCGSGLLSEPLARLGANVTGIDACKELIDVAKAHANLDPEIANKINYNMTTIEDFSGNNIEKYDAVVASEIIEHVNFPDLFIKSCVEVLKPGGTIIVTTINKTTLSWFAAIVFAEYVSNILPKGTHDWNKFISPNEVQKLLEHNNCRTKVVHGVFYVPGLNTWHWIPYTDVSYGIHAVKKE